MINSRTLLLLALRGGPQHGLGLIRRVERFSGGRYKILPGGLYPALKRMVEDGLATLLAVPSPGGRPLNIYELTDAGRRAARVEFKALQRLLKATSAAGRRK